MVYNLHKTGEAKNVPNRKNTTLSDDSDENFSVAWDFVHKH